ncbi:MAG TPA: hypothetical protein IAA32_02095 [Candidatus Butyricicoccus stercorigallinarum]|nr:hypothetical protein [Candidatus Butyricicoccus stercorigallinarum]
MEPADMLSSLLDDPETARKLAGAAAQLMGAVPAEAPQAEPPDAEHGEDPAAALLRRALPALSAAAQNSRPGSPARARLLHALRPFLSAQTCAQIDRAERILSAARMAQAAGQLLPQLTQRES